jgi:uncharacterized protein YqjF (DUF2071 family)
MPSDDSRKRLLLMTVDSWERSTQTKPWRMKQSWHNLLFAHWPIPIEDLQKLIPPPLQLDVYEGQAWVGVVPFHMSNIRYRNMPYIPTTSKFAELNVRTYVTLNNIPGVYFFSLDATSFLAVKAARYLYHLPYYFSDINIRNEDQRIYYQCRRIGTKDFQFKGTYKPISSPFKSHSGTLEHWLTERYCFYNSHLSRIFRCDILHKPWSLQLAEADIFVNTMANIGGLQLPNENPLLHYSERIDVLTWGLEEVVLK